MKHQTYDVDGHTVEISSVSTHPIWTLLVEVDGKVAGQGWFGLLGQHVEVQVGDRRMVARIAPAPFHRLSLEPADPPAK